jgi:hypothetical protein
MKKKATSYTTIKLTREPTEDEIRDYAYHLYQQSGCTPGHDLDHWLEAKACLEANIPPQHTRVRLHRQRHDGRPPEATIIALPPAKEEQASPLSAGDGKESRVKEPLAAGKARR